MLCRFLRSCRLLEIANGFPRAKPIFSEQPLRRRLYWDLRPLRAIAMSLAALVFFIAIEGLFVFRRAIQAQFSREIATVRRFLPIDNDGTAIALSTIQPARECGVYSLLSVHDLSRNGAVRRSFERLPAVTAVCVSRQGHVFLTADGNDVFALENPTTEPSLRRIGRNTRIVTDLIESSDDGQLLMMAGHDLTVWSPNDGELWRRPRVHVTSCRFIPGTSRMICALFEGPILELDALTGETLRVIVPARLLITRLAISSQGHLLALRDTTGNCRLFDLTTDREQAKISVAKNPGDIQFTTDGTALVVASPQAEVQWAVYSTDSLKLLRAVPGRSGPLTGLRLGSSGKVYVWNESRTVGVWRLDTGKLVERYICSLPNERQPWQVVWRCLQNNPLAVVVKNS
jgi:WD40 repeat protein